MERWRKRNRKKKERDEDLKNLFVSKIDEEGK